MNPPLLDGLEASTVQTARLRTHIITRGPADGVPIIFVHGNLSAARFWEDLLVSLPPQFRAIALDMRGYGRSEAAPVDATRGMRDFSDDLYALVEALELDRPHLVGWSLGGCVTMQYAIDHPEAVASITLIAPGSPYGFGGTRDLEGTPTAPNFAGSGAGMTNAEFVRRVCTRDRSAESPFSPRNVMNALYWKSPFRSPREEVFLDELLLIACGDHHYPGDVVPVSTWPGIAPGVTGINNALSPKHCNLAAFASIPASIPVLWIRGDSDQIVSDTSMSDVGMLGQLGVIPGWPGVEVFPPQPMVGQTRAVLDRFAARGGRYQEVVLSECGHSPHIEQPEAFRAAFFTFLEAQA
ncbi:MAG TPA: alpha/beta hydrolase [Herpetosiphonaceae bacterium]